MSTAGLHCRSSGRNCMARFPVCIVENEHICSRLLTPCFLQTSAFWQQTVHHSRCSSSTCRRRRLRVVARLHQSYPKSVGITRDEETGALVLVVGCVHGASASADDVRTVMSSAHPDAVVLELCQPRLEGLLHSMDRINSDSVNSSSSIQAEYTVSTIPSQVYTGTSTVAHKKRKSPFRSFGKMIQTFGGVGPAVVAFALNGVYGIQRRAGFDPGVEFKVAIANASIQSRRCRVICGDALASDTVCDIFRGISRPIRAISRAPRTLGCALQRVLHPPTGNVNMFRVLIEDRCARIREFASVFAPAVFVMYSSLLLSSIGSVYLRTFLFGASSVGNGLVDGPPGALSGLLVGLIDVGNFMLLAYVFLSVLTLLDVLIDARDRVLAKSVRDTIRAIGDERTHAAGDGDNCSGFSKDRGIVVVVVVGLLHVNGVLRHLNNLDGTST